MSRIAYVNGQYVPHAYGVTHIEDRGYQFADGVYEVIYYAHGHLVDAQEHLERLAYSLKELAIAPPMSEQALRHVIDEVVRLNRLQQGMVYIQISRGIAPRNHIFPASGQASLVVTTRPFDQQKCMAEKASGVKAISMEDMRWKRPDIKTISLLPNVLGKQKALDAGAYDALLINNGYVTESNVANVWIVRLDGTLQTHPAGEHILNGITRQRLILLARDKGYNVVEAAFTLEEVLQAREVFLSGSVSGIIPIIQVDQSQIFDGKPGPVVKDLSAMYQVYVAQGDNREAA
jgi:D-alanine transaminase